MSENTVCKYSVRSTVRLSHEHQKSLSYLFIIISPLPSHHLSILLLSLSLVVSPSSNSLNMNSGFQQHLLESYSSTDLVRYVCASPYISESSHNAFLLSPDLVAKRISTAKLSDELAAINLARKLSLRVPNIRRVVENKNSTYLIMDRIHGVVLEESWSQYGWAKTLRLALQLRRYVHAMRTCTSSTAGSMARGTCDSIWLDDFYKLPPHASPKAITSFLRFWLQYVPPHLKGSEFNGCVKARPYVPPTPTKFVFTHQDLAPRNLIVDRDGNLWILDWDHSGWYPSYFESVSMQNFHVRSGWSRTARLRWWIFSWISAGIKERERETMKFVRWKFIRWQLGRREELLPEGAPFHAVHLRKPGI
jgi:hypothetical protein